MTSIRVFLWGSGINPARISQARSEYNSPNSGFSAEGFTPLYAGRVHAYNSLLPFQQAFAGCRVASNHMNPGGF